MEQALKQAPTKPARSLATRARILAEAQRAFAELGFEKASIRAIAAKASIHPSMVMRYFHSKEELFATAASVDFHMPNLLKVEPERRGQALIAHIMEQWEGEGTRRELQVLLRAAGTHDRARQRFVEFVQQQALPAIRKVVASDHQEERIALILMQVAGLVISRYLLAYPQVVAMPRGKVVQSIGFIVQGYLAGPFS